VRATTAVVTSLSVRDDVGEAAATGLLLATDVADYLVGRGLPFRHAHEVVGGIVRDLVANGGDFASLTTAEWKGYHELFEDDVSERITARGSVQARKTPQSTHPDAVRASLEGVRRWVEARS